RLTLSIVPAMNACPPKPGSTDMASATSSSSSSRTLGRELPDGVHDVPGGYPRRVEQLGGRARAGHVADGEVHEALDVTRDARRDHRDRIVRLPATHDAAPADAELLEPVGVEDRRLLARRAEVADAPALGHEAHQPRGLVRVARVEDRAAVDRAHHREVLEGHLRRTVLPDGDAGVRATQADARTRDRRHA